mmetsp:Transcript_58857/g.137024  ORF Transcript_58857/g.137024 Transcript_58857/m.137024 type:complete len:237 (+) Transcript_58857:840-1550(+)
MALREAADSHCGPCYLLHARAGLLHVCRSGTGWGHGFSGVLQHRQHAALRAAPHIASQEPQGACQLFGGRLRHRGKPRLNSHLLHHGALQPRRAADPGAAAGRVRGRDPALGPGCDLLLWHGLCHGGAIRRDIHILHCESHRAQPALHSSTAQQSPARAQRVAESLLAWPAAGTREGQVWPPHQQQATEGVARHRLGKRCCDELADPCVNRRPTGQWSVTTWPLQGCPWRNTKEGQ